MLFPCRLSVLFRGPLRLTLLAWSQALRTLWLCLQCRMRFRVLGFRGFRGLGLYRFFWVLGLRVKQKSEALERDL